ncbi:MAG: terminase family protein [Pseudomonadota bacterium]
MEIELNYPQYQFMTMKQPMRALIGGYGSGKTYTICIAQIQHFLRFPKIPQAYYAPTYPLIRDIYYPTMSEVAEIHGFTVDIKTSDKEVHFYRYGKYYGHVICRTMDNPANIVGYKVGRSAIDEIDTLKTKKAEEAWVKIIARQRYKYSQPNGVDFATTPEGFKFAYNVFERLKFRDKSLSSDMYGYVRASTYENEKYLPEGYIKNLFETYPENLVKAFINGEFVNLEVGSVYPAFSRKTHSTNESIKDGETVHIGMDFNIGNMMSAVYVVRKNTAYLLDEISDRFDTNDMLSVINDRFAKNKILLYPDASGKNRNTAASQTDLMLLRQSGNAVIVNPSNPAVKDRLNAVNAKMMNGDKNISFFVNTNKCPCCTKTLEQQTLKDGSPDKSSGLDHAGDALGYPIAKIFPVVRNNAKVDVIRL